MGSGGFDDYLESTFRSYAIQINGRRFSNKTRYYQYNW